MLLHLIEDWKDALDKNSVVGTVIMDLSKLSFWFATTRLIMKLPAYGISTHSLHLVKSYLTNRRQRVRVEDVTSYVSYVNSGVPRDFVLWPLLFNIFINDWLYFIKEAKLSNYTDDNQLYFAVVEHVLNKELVVVCGGFVITRWSWTLKNARRWFSRENLMSSYPYLLKVLPYH